MPDQLSEHKILVVGAGIFGVTAALELRRRGYAVGLFDPGPIPHPWAESTDISKVVRLEYGPDEEYMALVEQALQGWEVWNAAWPEPLYHEVGLACFRSTPMEPGGFEYESVRLLRQRGHHPVRLDAETIRRRFPAWNADKYIDGFFHARAGYAESGKVVTRLLAAAQAQGVEIHGDQRVVRLIVTQRALSRIGAA